MGLDEYLRKLEEQHPNIPYLYAILGNIMLSAMNIFFKFLTKIASPLQILFMRAFSLMVFNIWVLGEKSPHIARPQTFKMILMRILCTSGSSAITHFCLKYLPVSIVATLYNTNPIFIFFVEALYYKKSFDKISLSLTILSFCGVLLIIQPSFLFGQTRTLASIEHYDLLVVSMLVSSVLIGLGMIFMHDSAKYVPTVVNLHYSYMGHMFFSSMFANFHQPLVEFKSFDVFYGLMFLGVLCSALLCQYMIFASSSLMKPSRVMPFGYVGVVVSFIADLYIFQADFDIWAVLGIILTSLGLIGKYLLEKKETDKNQREIAQQQEAKQEQLAKM